jgi:hypothetical protein
MDRNAGYVTDVDYTYGYYNAVQPDLLALACMNAGIAPPAGEPGHYLELGYGKGVSLNIHAAANPGTFWGTDLNAGYAAEAAILAEASGSRVRLFAQSFAEFAARPDLPEFDVIVTHGVWSWLTPENRRFVVDLLRRRLSIGGLFYVAYNCSPGGATLDPLNQLLALHAEFAGTGASDTLDRLDHALRFAEEVAESDALYFRDNPTARPALSLLAGRDRKRLAHEALSRGRTVMTSAGVAEELAEAGLRFAASARLVDHFDALNLSPGDQQLLAKVRHPVFRQTVLDYLVDRQVRADIFVKGVRRLSALERSEALHTRSFVLATDAADLRLEVKGARGTVALDEQTCRPLLEVLAEGRHEPKTLRRIAQHPRLQSISRQQIMHTLLLLLAADHVSIAREPSAETRAHCKALNSHLLARTQDDGDIAWLASPVMGGGVPASRIEQLFLTAVATGKRAPAEQAAAAWRTLSSRGRGLMHEGKVLRTAQESLAHLAGEAAQFTRKRLPILETLEVL